MGGLVPPVMSSSSLNMCQYSTRKGFSQTREKVVDLKRKKFGGSSSAKLLLNLNCFFVTRLIICRGKSHSPEGAHNTFEKERICFWGFWDTHFPSQKVLGQTINTGLLGILPVSQAPQNLFDEAEVETTKSGIVQSSQT